MKALLRRGVIGMAGVLASWCALAAEPAQTQAGEDTASSGASEVWVNTGGFSRHFARDRGYNETNWGLGAEYRFNEELSVMGGGYYNSIRRTTSYATVNYQPFHLGDFKIGASVGVMDGYPAIARGGTFFVALPMATYEGKRFGLNLGVIPSTKNVDGALIIQFKVRAF